MHLQDMPKVSVAESRLGRWIIKYFSFGKIHLSNIQHTQMYRT